MSKYIQKICSKCPKDVHCCRFSKDGFVFVGIKDAKNIKKQSDLEFKDFLEWKKLSKKTIKLLKRSPKYSEGFMRLNQLRKNKILVLKTKDNKNCIFFDKNQCTIYQQRPLICRMYPYWFFLGKKRFIISHGEDSKCKALKHNKVCVILKEKELNQLKNFQKR